MQNCITHRSWRRSTQYNSRGCSGRYRQRADRDAGPGHMPLLGSVSRVLWGSWATARSGNVNQKSVPQRSYLQVTRSEGHERLGRLLTTWAVRGVTSGAHIRCDSTAHCPDMRLHAGASASLLPLQATWPDKMGAQAAIPWGGLVKLLTV